MAYNLQVFDRFSMRMDNTDLHGGSNEVPVTFDVDGEAYERTFSVATAANAVIFNTDFLSSFNFFFIQSDYTVRLKLTDSNPVANTFSMWLRGTGVTNRFGVPFILANDNTTSTYVINAAQIFNTSGSTARIRIVAIK